MFNSQGPLSGQQRTQTKASSLESMAKSLLFALA